MKLNSQYIIAGNRLVTYVGDEETIDFITGETIDNVRFELVKEPDSIVLIRKELLSERVLTLDEFDHTRKHYSYPSIGRPNQLFREIIERQQYNGRDAKGKASYDKNKELTLITIEGSVKLDGANCSIVLTKDDDLYAQSRTILINRVDDIYGFNTFFEQHRDFFYEKLKSKLADNFAVAIYGEWVGRNNTKDAAMKDVDNVFVIFDIYLIKEDERNSSVNANNNRSPQAIETSHDIRSEERRIYTVDQFPTWKYDVHPDKFYTVNNALVELTEQVEQECPVAKHFGVSGIGEGIVWVSSYTGKKFRMKVKGQKHSATNVDVLKRIDDVVIELRALVDATVTTARLKQGLDYLKIGGLETTANNAGKFIQWVIDDIFKEESEDLTRLGVDRKQFTKEVSSKIARWFHANI